MKDFKSPTPREILLRLPDVMERVGLSRSAIYAAMAEGEFPRPVRLTKRAVAWPASAIDAWITARVTAGAER
jgi:prophage regulatory protein